MEKVIIGVDDKDEALDALRLGHELAVDQDADVTVVSVFAPDLLETPIHYEEARADYVRDTADRAALELGETGFRHIAAVAETPAGALEHVAEDEDADLIVIGSTRRGPLGRVFPGSVGERLLHGATCNVAVAPRGYARREHPRIGMVGIAYDGSPESGRALEEACRIAGARDATLQVITVARRFTEAPRLLGTGEAIRDHFRRILDEGRTSAADGIELEALLEEGDTAPALADRGVELDLLVVGSRGHGPLGRVLLGSTSAEVMRMAPCPVIVVPRGAKPAAGKPEASQRPTAGYVVTNAGWVP